MATLLGRAVTPGGWLPRKQVLRDGLAGWIAVPQAEARGMLAEVARRVADLPRGEGRVIWQSGADELLVDTAATTLSCQAGVLQVAVVCACDQVDGQAPVLVSFATGTREDPRGLFMAAYDRVSGPAPIADAWSSQVTAFAWEVLLTLATEVAAAAGHDRAGRSLVPAAIGAERGALLIRPMARVS